MKDGQGQSFPHASRLSKGADFKRVFEKPSVSADGFFKVLARKNKLGSCRLGMAVSRKVDRRAVGRNRIKRVVRESFRQRVLGEGNRVASLDFVVLPRLRCDTICNQKLTRSLEKHWDRLIED